MKKVGHTSEFVLHLLMNLKATFYLKNCGRGPTKNVRISMLHFKKKKEKHLEIPLFYTCVPKTQKSWYDLQFLKYTGCFTKKSHPTFLDIYLKILMTFAKYFFTGFNLCPFIFLPRGHEKTYINSIISSGSTEYLGSLYLKVEIKHIKMKILNIKESSKEKFCKNKSSICR